MCSDGIISHRPTSPRVMWFIVYFVRAPFERRFFSFIFLVISRNKYFFIFDLHNEGTLKIKLGTPHDLCPRLRKFNHALCTKYFVPMYDFDIIKSLWIILQMGFNAVRPHAPARPLWTWIQSHRLMIYHYKKSGLLWRLSDNRASICHKQRLFMTIVHMMTTVCDQAVCSS